MSTTSTTTKAPVTSPKPTTAPSTTRAMTSTQTREPTTLPTGAGKTVKTCADRIKFPGKFKLIKFLLLPKLAPPPWQKIKSSLGHPKGNIY